MKVKAVIFDLDGTLLDTGRGIVKCVASTLSQMGLAVPNEEICESFVGPPLKKRFLELFKTDEKAADDFVRLFREEYAKGDIFLADRYPGMDECLALLRGRFPLAVATNKREDFAVKLLEKFEMASYFDAICGSDATSSITKEQIVANAAKRLGVKPADCLMVGDSLNDAEAAAKLGMQFIGVTYGYGFKSENDQANFLAYAQTSIKIKEIVLHFEEIQMKKNNRDKKKSFCEEDFVPVEKCRFCGGTTKELGIYLKSPLIHHTKCMTCEAVSYDKILKQEKIPVLYSEYAYSSESDSKVTFSNIDRFAKHLLKYCVRFKKNIRSGKSLKIMDFGGGDGSLSYVFAKKMMHAGLCDKADIAVIDFEKTICKSDSPNIKIMHYDNLDLIDKDVSFNIIIASAILEHLPNLREDWNKILMHFKDDGLIYVRTPYKYPLFNLLKKIGIRIGLHFPEHIWDLGQNFYKHLASDDIKLVASRPSIVETSFKMNFFSCLAAHCLKAPWYICHFWPYVGGWEAIYVKNGNELYRNKRESPLGGE